MPRSFFGALLLLSLSRSLLHPFLKSLESKYGQSNNQKFEFKLFHFRRGHDVTAVMPFKEKTNNYKIIWSDPDSQVMKAITKGTDPLIKKETSDPFAMLSGMMEFAFSINDNAMKDPMMKEMLNDPNTKFDIVIVQPFPGSEAGYYLAKRFNAPLAIYLTAQSNIPFVNTALGQPFNPSYMPLVANNFVAPMTFFQRVINTFTTFMFEHVIRKHVMLPNAYKILAKHFPNEDIPDLIELEKDVSVAFTFGHPLFLDGWSPMAPNYVQLGMMNCRPAKEFPPDDAIGNFLKKSKNGVVFMSFGSVVQPSLMPKEYKDIFLNVFRKFPQYDFIWKWDDEVPEAPKNVLISSWLPQQEILGHPNLKVFVTHAGQSSFQETLCHQKPAVAVPVMGDQLLNALEMQGLGFGISVPYTTLTKEDLYNALDKVLHNPRYAEAAKAVGSLANDQITRPLDRAIWWIEHVIRHPTMYAGRSPVHKLSWYQYFLLDVFAFLAFILYVIVKIIKILFRFCCQRKTKTKEE